jgi:hypothetical protein
MSAKQQTKDWGAWAADKLVIPAATALFTLGGAWVAFGNVKEDVADLQGKQTTIELNQSAHELLEGHPITLERWRVLTAEITAMKNDDRRRDSNIGAICTATAADCEF